MNIEKGKNKKGIAFFSWLIVIVAFIVFNLALFNLYFETSSKIESVSSLKPVASFGNSIDFIPFYLNLTLEIAKEQAFIDYFENIDSSGKCMAINLNNKNYFDILSCKLNQEEFIQKLITNFNIDFQNYLYEISKEKSEKEKEGKFKAICERKEDKVYCSYEINKSFDMDYVKIKINKKDQWQGKINLNSFNELNRINNELIRGIEAIRQEIKKNKEIKEEDKDKMLSRALGEINSRAREWFVDGFWLGGNIFITITPKKAILDYKLNLVYKND